MNCQNIHSNAFFVTSGGRGLKLPDVLDILMSGNYDVDNFLNAIKNDKDLKMLFKCILDIAVEARPTIKQFLNPNKKELAIMSWMKYFWSMVCMEAAQFLYGIEK